MKRFMCILISIISCIILIACEDSSDHTGEAKTPSGSSVMNGRDYQSVVEEFEENGFTNIKLEKMEDLIIGWLKEDGEVEDVSVGGDFDYSPDKWVPNDTEVIIRYHTFPEEEEEDTQLHPIPNGLFCASCACVSRHQVQAWNRQKQMLLPIFDSPLRYIRTL